MPIVLRVLGYRFWFYEADIAEPPHVHVGKESMEAKYWIRPIRLAKSRGFRQHELNQIEKILSDHQDFLIEAWEKETRKHGDR